MHIEFEGEGDAVPKKGSTTCHLVIWLFLFPSAMQKNRFVTKGRGKVLMSR